MVLSLEIIFCVGKTDFFLIWYENRLIRIFNEFLVSSLCFFLFHSMQKGQWIRVSDLLNFFFQKHTMKILSKCFSISTQVTNFVDRQFANRKRTEDFLCRFVEFSFISSGQILHVFGFASNFKIFCGWNELKNASRVVSLFSTVERFCSR